VTPTSPTHGWILLCNNGSQDEYLRNGLIGLKEQYLPRLQSLQQGDPVLLYNFESSQLVAFLFASGIPGMDIKTDGSFKKYRAQVPVRLEVQFDPPIGREKLQTIPDLYFDARGYLVNFTVPMELVLSIVDMAAGRKATSHEPAAREEVDFRRKFPPKFLCSDGHWVRSKAMRTSTSRLATVTLNTGDLTRRSIQTVNGGSWSCTTGTNSESSPFGDKTSRSWTSCSR
jgi:development and cell death domain-containing protein